MLDSRRQTFVSLLQAFQLTGRSLRLAKITFQTFAVEQIVKLACAKPVTRVR